MVSGIWVWVTSTGLTYGFVSHQGTGSTAKKQLLSKKRDLSLGLLTHLLGFRPKCAFPEFLHESTVATNAFYPLIFLVHYDLLGGKHLWHLGCDRRGPSTTKIKL
jgi:hypothetical protein